MQLSSGRTLVLADIPGIIEGAHEGKGLGLRFLRHIERTRTLAYLIPVTGEDPQGEYDLLRRELAEYSRELAGKPHCIVLSKADLLAEGAEPPELASEAFATYRVSGVARTGLQELAEGLWDAVRQVIAEEESEDGFADDGRSSATVGR